MGVRIRIIALLLILAAVPQDSHTRSTRSTPASKLSQDGLPNNTRPKHHPEPGAWPAHGRRMAGAWPAHGRRMAGAWSALTAGLETGPGA